MGRGKRLGCVVPFAWIALLAVVSAVLVFGAFDAEKYNTYEAYNRAIHRSESHAAAVGLLGLVLVVALSITAWKRNRQGRGDG